MHLCVVTPQVTFICSVVHVVAGVLVRAVQSYLIASVSHFSKEVQFHHLSPASFLLSNEESDLSAQKV